MMWLESGQRKRLHNRIESLAHDWLLSPCMPGGVWREMPKDLVGQSTPCRVKLPGTLWEWWQLVRNGVGWRLVRESRKICESGRREWLRSRTRLQGLQPQGPLSVTYFCQGCATQRFHSLPKILPLAKDQVFSLVSLMKCKIFQFKAEDIVSITSEESLIQRVESVAYR